MQSNGKSRRRHSPEFKQQVIAACAQPGASVAGVALSFGLNDNLVHQWRRGRGIGTGLDGSEVKSSGFVALALPAPALPDPVAVVATPDAIRIELQRGSMSVKVAWPVAASASCAAWLRELLR